MSATNLPGDRNVMVAKPAGQAGARRCHGRGFAFEPQLEAVAGTDEGDARPIRRCWTASTIKTGFCLSAGSHPAMADTARRTAA